MKADNFIKLKNEINCNCGCSSFRIQEYDWKVSDGDDDNDVEFSFISDYIGSNGGKRFPAFIDLIKHKPTCHASIILNKEDAIKFLEDALNQLKRA